MSTVPRTLRRASRVVMLKVPEDLVGSVDSLTESVGYIELLSESVAAVADELAQIRDLIYKETLT